MAVHIAITTFRHADDVGVTSTVGDDARQDAGTTADARVQRGQPGGIRVADAKHGSSTTRRVEPVVALYSTGRGGGARAQFFLFPPPTLVRSYRRECSASVSCTPVHTSEHYAFHCYFGQYYTESEGSRSRERKLSAAPSYV